MSSPPMRCGGEGCGVSPGAVAGREAPWSRGGPRYIAAGRSCHPGSVCPTKKTISKICDKDIKHVVKRLPFGMSQQGINVQRGG